MADTHRLRQLMRQLERAQDTLEALSDRVISAKAAGDAMAERKAAGALRDHVHQMSALQDDIEAERGRTSQ